MTENCLLEVNQRKVLKAEEVPPFQVNVGDVVNPYKFQFFLDFGSSPGPWVTIGINDTAYSVGYIPHGSEVK